MNCFNLSNNNYNNENNFPLKTLLNYYYYLIFLKIKFLNFILKINYDSKNFKHQKKKIILKNILKIS